MQGLQQVVRDQFVKRIVHGQDPILSKLDESNQNDGHAYDRCLVTLAHEASAAI